MTERRVILKSALGAAALSAAPMLHGAPALAGHRPVATRPKARFVVVFLRGGVDGLALVPAPGDPDFSKMRAHLGEGSTNDGQNALPLDGFFALHPKLASTRILWQARQLAVIHAVHTVSRNRSHFDAQDLLEIGLNRLNSRADGWMNRALAYYAPGARPLGLAVGFGMPLIFRGPAAVATWAPRYLPEPEAVFLQSLQIASQSDPAVASALSEGVQLAEANRQLLGPDAVGGHGGPRSAQMVTQLARATGKMLSVEEGARIASFEVGGWDTHGYQNIAHAYRMPVLDNALAGLREGLGTAWQHTAVLVVTEFGRTVKPNGTNGTDHGTAGAALLLGGAIAGGRVFADWPGLRQRDLYEGRDLTPTTDMRSIFKAVLERHIGMDRSFIEDTVFSGSRNIKPFADIVAA